MDLILNPFSLTLIFSGLLVGCLSLIIAFKMGDGTKWVAITMICGAIWGVFYGLELSATDLETILIYVHIQYFGISFLGASWFIFTLKYTETDLIRYKVGIFFILVIPTLTFIFVITNEFHHFHYISYKLVSVGGIIGLKTEVGPWYFVHVIYSYILFLLGNFIIWKRFRFSDQLFKTQTRLIFIAGLFLIVFNALYQFGIYRPFEIIDLTPYSFLFSYIVLGIAIVRYQLFSLKPIDKNIIFEAITKGVLVLDLRQKIVDFNHMIFVFFPNQKSISIGTNAKLIFEPYPYLLNILDSTEKQILEICLDQQTDSRIAFVEIKPLRDKENIQRGTILLFEDITETVNTKNLLIAQKTELQQLNNLKDKYFSIISHELKGPIFGVKELINLTQTGLISNEEFIELLPEVSKNMENVSQLLENLLAWTRSQLKGEQVILERFDIKKILIRQKQILSRISAEKNISINIDIPEEEFRVVGDKNMVDLIIRNLINNALKFSPPSSETIISAELQGDFTKISIKDFGSGISEENLKKINHGISFTTKGQNNENGTGLGLILVQEYIKKNSGKLEVESTAGVGSIFSIYLLSDI
ncbi:MAG: signal transduction histidine kinase [Algoriphagus sp.]|jgi:signal transduction histidine kinase